MVFDCRFLYFQPYQLALPSVSVNDSSGDKSVFCMKHGRVHDAPSFSNNRISFS